jgi:List-Bact-rpt repeat protein
VLAGVLGSAPVASSQTFTFTDAVLNAEVTPVRAAHIAELRQAIATVRSLRGLAAFSYTDPTLTGGATPVRAVHISELRTALNGAFEDADLPRPTYTDATLTATVIKRVHIEELRGAVANRMLQTVVLTVAKSGAGSVMSDPSGISCGVNCTASFPIDAAVRLIATPDHGWIFIAWSGACTGAGPCTVAMNADKAVTAIFSMQTFGLAVTKTGNGTVTSNPAGINCGVDCMVAYLTDTVVTLTAAPASGWAFGGWAGACSGTGTCTVTMIADAAVTATFTRQTFHLAVTKAGNGTVTSSPAGIDCGATCTASFSSDTVVELTPTPDPGWSFSAWTGACTGAGPCSVKMTADTAVTATFTSTPFMLTVAKLGNGTVASSPVGIDCGATCQSLFNSSTSVILTATAAPGFVFTSWSGCESPVGNTCTMTINNNSTVTATFIQQFTLTVTKVGTGTGTVTSSPAAIDCGSSCQASFNSSATVTLTATAASDEIFTGWSGGVCVGRDACHVTINMATSITATFEKLTAITGVTDNTGSVSLIILGQNQTFTFADGPSGAPISGLSVGITIDAATQALGLLMIIDPAGRYPLRFIILHGAIATQASSPAMTSSLASPAATSPSPQRLPLFSDLNAYGEVAAEAARPAAMTSSLASPTATSSSSPQRLPLFSDLNALIPPQVLAVLKPLYEKIDLALTLQDIAQIVATGLDKSGVPIGKYASYLSAPQTEMMSADDALNENRAETQSGVKSELVFLTIGAILNPEIALGLELVQGMYLVLGQWGMDQSTLLACKSQGGNVQVTKFVIAGTPLKFYACIKLTLQEITQQLVRVSATDPFGQPLGQGSLELLSKANMGLGFIAPISSGGVQVPVPVGNYQATVRAPGFRPSVNGLTVGAGGSSLNVKLEPGIPTLVAHTMTKAVIPGTCPTIPPSAYTFKTTDSQAQSWTHVAGVQSGDTMQWEWHKPDGSIYFATNPLQFSAAGNYCSWATLNIAGSMPSVTPGNWSVRVTYNGSVIVTETFKIAAGQCTGFNDTPNVCGPCNTDADCPGNGCWLGNPPAPFCGP